MRENQQPGVDNVLALMENWLTGMKQQEEIDFLQAGSW